MVTRPAPELSFKESEYGHEYDEGGLARRDPGDSGGESGLTDWGGEGFWGGGGRGVATWMRGAGGGKGVLTHELLESPHAAGQLVEVVPNPPHPLLVGTERLPSLPELGGELLHPSLQLAHVANLPDQEQPEADQGGNQDESPSAPAASRARGGGRRTGGGRPLGAITLAARLGGLHRGESGAGTRAGIGHAQDWITSFDRLVLRRLVF